MFCLVFSNVVLGGKKFRDIDLFLKKQFNLKLGKKRKEKEHKTFLFIMGFFSGSLSYP